MSEETNQTPTNQQGGGYISRTSRLGGKDYIGYAMGDFAGCLCFATVTTLLQKYYTDILGLSPLFIMIMFIAARVWDAINDPIMGRIVDLKKPGKGGRYRVWMKYAAIPLAAATILMFLPWGKAATESAPGEGMVGAMGPILTMVYATVTYIVFGMIYTMHQIPYGSLASVVTTDVKERNKLSVFRSVGAALGSIPVLLVTFFWAKETTKEVGGEIVKIMQVQYTPIIIGVVASAVVACVLLFIAFKWNRERVVAVKKDDAPKEKGETVSIVKALLKNRSFLGVCLVGMLLLAGQMFTQSFYTYLFNDMFKANWMNMVSMVCTYFPMAVLMLFAGKLVRKFGKKEICAVGASIAAFANIALLALKPVIVKFPPLFLAFCLISGIGLSIITLEIWALATDAIDDVEVKTGKRSDGTSYSVFMFFRKLGQVLAAVAVNSALLGMNYFVQGTDQVFTEGQLNTMYYMSTAIPAGLFGLMALVLFLLYGLNHKKTAQLQVEKEKLLAEQVANNEISVGGETGEAQPVEEVEKDQYDELVEEVEHEVEEENKE